MQLMRDTWNKMIVAICVLSFIVVAGSCYMAYQVGAWKGYTLGRDKEAMISPFRPYVESGKKFVYDDGVIYEVRRGKKSYIPIYPIGR